MLLHVVLNIFRYGPNNNGTGSVTNGVHSSRPATGIDLALGLNGYSDKMLSGLEADKVLSKLSIKV